MSEEFSSLTRLIVDHSEAALGTLDAGRPFVSATGYVLENEKDLSVAILLSALSRHTRNIQKNACVSLLVIEQTEVPVHEKMRATLIGDIQRVEDPLKIESLKRDYLQKFPKSQIFFSLPDFRFYSLSPQEIHWIGGFGRAKTFVCKESGWE